ncbi:hypothetical protein [Phorcysia thermohydrogeniphila]|uniref:Uncharacterized protein n=1 Tax=Phorcysia thermohydrogeniphila TaxID=936138 RepID=A0A4V2PDT8_9BACT|nr:hypothetical protein [Phorcysia thermohydrogeniphila]TCK06526.1 hypothetical protein CLV27_0327 [Phorcysia thermohydrogeniphila]
MTRINLRMLRFGGYEKVSFLIFFFFLLVPAWGRELSLFVSESVSKNLLSVAEKILDSSLNPPEKGLNLLKSFMLETVCQSSEYQLKGELLGAVAEELERDWGLKLGTNLRFSTGDLNLYDRSARLGVTWDIVKNGLLENRLKEREVLLRRELLALEESLKGKKDSYTCRRNLIAYYFAVLKIPILERKLKVLKHLYGVLRESYFRGFSLADDGFEVELELHKTEEKLKYYRKLISVLCSGDEDYCRLSPKAFTYPPVLRLEFPVLIKAVKQDSKRERLKELQRELVELKRSWVHDLQLQVYLAFSTKGDETLFSKKGVITGVSLSVPLRRKSPLVEELELQQAEEEVEAGKRKLLETLFQLYDLQEEKVSDAVKMWYRLKVAAERLRRSLLPVERQLPSGKVYLRDYITFLKSLSNFLDVQYEFLCSEELLYRRLVYLLLFSGVDWDDSLVSSVSLTPLWDRMRKGERSVFVNRKTLSAYPPFILENFLIAKGIRKLELPVEAVEKGEYSRLLKHFKEKGIDLEVVFNVSSLDSLEVAVKRVRELLKAGYSLNLDLRGLDGREVKEIIGFIGKVHDLALHSGQSLTVTLPDKFREELIHDLALNCDRLVVSTPLLKLPKGKFGLLVEVKKFGSEEELEGFIDKVYSKLGVSSFVLYDLESLVELSSLNFLGAENR